MIKFLVNKSDVESFASSATRKKAIQHTEHLTPDSTRLHPTPPRHPNLNTQTSTSTSTSTSPHSTEDV